MFKDSLKSKEHDESKPILANLKANISRTDNTIKPRQLIAWFMTVRGNVAKGNTTRIKCSMNSRH